MTAEIIDMNERAREAWEAYVCAKDRALYTMDFQDALAAGRAWRTFLNLFVGPDMKMSLNHPVVQLDLSRRR